MFWFAEFFPKSCEKIHGMFDGLSSIENSIEWNFHSFKVCPVKWGFAELLFTLLSL